MYDAVQKTLPADIAVCAAAVADYGIQMHDQKQKKSDGKLDIQFTENPDILHTIATHQYRPDFVVGFAAETENLIKNAKEKLLKKQCDAIVANLVGQTSNPVFGTDQTSIHWVTKLGDEAYKNISKSDVADIVVTKTIDYLKIKMTNKKENVA
jgi:phosphopantothenoylcysteine decarboxylase/phosphopantothenate--cysteine ligase